MLHASEMWHNLTCVSLLWQSLAIQAHDSVQFYWPHTAALGNSLRALTLLTKLDLLLDGAQDFCARNVNLLIGDNIDGPGGNLALLTALK